MYHHTKHMVACFKASCDLLAQCVAGHGFLEFAVLVDRDRVDVKYLQIYGRRHTMNTTNSMNNTGTMHIKGAQCLARWQQTRRSREREREMERPIHRLRPRHMGTGK